MSAPAVTVLLAVHNGADYLSAAVRSVLDQTFADFELLVVDDASSDESVRILESFGDPRIEVVCNERNLGQVASLNIGLRVARGDIVARMDHDDVCHPRRLELQVEALRREPGAGLVGSWVQLVDGDDQPIGSIEGVIEDRVDFVYWTLVQNLLISHPAAAFRREPVLALGGYDETMGPSEDKDLWRRLLLAGWDARVVPETLVRYRVHEDQLSQTRTGLQHRNDDRSQEALFAELAPGTPARALRLLLAGDTAVWTEANDQIDLPAALEALLAGTRDRVGLDEDEAAALRRRIAGRVSTATLSGWRVRGGNWRTAGPSLMAWAEPGRRPATLRTVQAAAPLLRIGTRMMAAATVRAARASILAPTRDRLRKRQTLRRIYARVTRTR